MMEQLLIAMDGMQEALTATQESRLESERIAHAHTASLVDLKVIRYGRILNSEEIAKGDCEG